VSYLDNLLEQLSKKEVRSGHSLADVDPGGVPIGGYSKIPTKVFEKIEAKIGLARKHRNSFRDAVDDAVRICWDLEGRRQRALGHAALKEQLVPIQEAAETFASELKALTSPQAEQVNEVKSSSSTTSQTTTNQWIRDNLEELLLAEVRSWVEAGNAIAQEETDAATKKRVQVSPHEAVFSNLSPYASPAEDVAKACRILLLQLDLTRPTAGSPRNVAFKCFARRLSAALKNANLPSKVTYKDAASSNKRYSGKLMETTMRLITRLPKTALPESTKGFRRAAIGDALRRAVRKGA
jgi:DNA-binding ferritin-like protein